MFLRDTEEQINLHDKVVDMTTKMLSHIHLVDLWLKVNLTILGVNFE